MPFHLKWSSEDNCILVIQVEEPVSWDSWHLMLDELAERAATTQNRIDIISVPQARLPEGNPVPHFKRLSNYLQQQDNIGLYVIVNPMSQNFVVRAIQQMLKAAGIMMAKYESAPTVAEAHETIRQDRRR